MNSTGYDIATITQMVGGKLIRQGENVIIKNLLLDSRNPIRQNDSLFFAIKGVRHDGHHFIADLHKQGFRHFIVSDEPRIDLPDSNVILVGDTLEALQKLAAKHRRNSNLAHTYAITGSNGKTVVKEWLGKFYRQNGYSQSTVTSPKSYNSQVGVPLSLWNIGESDYHAFFEAGISQPGEMDKLREMIQPTAGIFTNIGYAHSENFESQQQKADEKIKLFENCDLLYYCEDYPEVREAARNLEHGPRLVTWSMKGEADLQIGTINYGKHGAEIEGFFRNKRKKIRVPFTDKASIENAILCWLIVLDDNFSDEQIEEFMVHLQPVAMRMELLDGVNNCTIINDVYSSDLNSLSIALDLVRQQRQHGTQTFILSDIHESGLDGKELYAEMAKLLAPFAPYRLIGVGQEICKHVDLFESYDVQCFNSTTECLEALPKVEFVEETILVKGARQYRFEQISLLLQRLAHETVLEINLSAAEENLNYFRSKLKPETKIMSMVKAFSYGSGSYEIANILEFNRVDYLAVAYADEGVDLRKAGISMPIMVMNPEAKSFDLMYRHRLEPEIYSFKLLKAVSDFAWDLEGERKYPIHLKIDTGMHRLGFEAHEIPELIEVLKANASIEIKSIFSHLTSSDEPEHDDFTRQQIQLFEKLSSQIQAAVDYPIMRHILNSSGIVRFPEAQFDMVRLGIGMYGIAPDEETQSQLQNVTTLRTVISQIRTVEAGETIGYSRKGIANEKMQVATLPIGYADGLNRRLSNGSGSVSINGKLAPIVGNVCMDMVMVDVTDIDANEGDEAVIFGEEISIHDIAVTLGTIPYEILTMISRRVKRVYYRD